MSFLSPAAKPCGEDHAHPDIVRPVCLGLLRRGDVAGGDTEKLVRSDETPGCLGGHILLSHMHAVGIHRQGDIYTVVHQENGPVLPAQVLDRSADPNHLAGVHVLLSELNALGAALERLARLLDMVSPRNNFGVGDDLRVELQRHA